MPTNFSGVNCTAMPLAPRDLVIPGAKLLRPHQLGWLRKPEWDLHGAEVWEMPNGNMHYHDPSQGPLLLNWYRFCYPQINETGRPPDV